MSPVRTRSLALFFCRRSSGVERFLGKEEVGSSNLLVGSTGNQGVKPKSCQHLNSLSETLFKFRCFFVPTLFIHFYRNTIAWLPCAQHMLFHVKKDEQIWPILIYSNVFTVSSAIHFTKNETSYEWSKWRIAFVCMI